MKLSFEEKIFRDLTSALQKIEEWKTLGYNVVFTNGCFDLIHRGHVVYLQEARSLGDKLIVGLNSDASVSRLKGPNRPVQSEHGRASVIASMSFVDMVVFFDTETPHELIKRILPDILVKGGDYKEDDIVGAKEVREHGGEVKVLSFIEGESTSNIIDKIKSAYA
jgi:rfaE bifunctional protein nucleotidyltransferase chain/domain